MIKILAADDHALVLGGIGNIVDAASGMQIATRVSTGSELIAELKAHDYDLILTDLSMPDLGGMALISAIREMDREVPVLVLTMHDDPQTAVAAINLGINGYLSKGCAADNLHSAIRSCAAGGKYIEPRLAASIVFEQVASAGRAAHDCLSSREMQVFRMLVAGESVSGIARKLHVSPKTVSTHKLRIVNKLGLASLSDMVRYAIKHGLVDI